MTSPTNKSTGVLNSDTLIMDGKAIVAGIQIITDGTNDATLILYDNTAASGKEVFKASLTGTNDPLYISLPDGGVRCDNGLYADVTGTGAEFIVHYR